MSTVWKSWKLPSGRGVAKREVTVDSNDSIQRGARYVLIFDPGFGDDWVMLSLAQTKALLAILPDVIAVAEAA